MADRFIVDAWKNSKTKTEIAASTIVPATAFVWPGYSSLAANGFLLPVIEALAFAAIGWGVVHQVKELRRTVRVINETNGPRPSLSPVLRGAMWKCVSAGVALWAVNAAAARNWINPNDNVVHGLVTISDHAFPASWRLAPDATLSSVTTNLTNDLSGNSAANQDTLTLGPAKALRSELGYPLTGSDGKTALGSVVTGQDVCVLAVVNGGRAIVYNGVVTMLVPADALTPDSGGTGCPPSTPNPFAPAVPKGNSSSAQAGPKNPAPQ